MHSDSDVDICWIDSLALGVKLSPLSFEPDVFWVFPNFCFTFSSLTFSQMWDTTAIWLIQHNYGFWRVKVTRGTGHLTVVHRFQELVGVLILREAKDFLIILKCQNCIYYRLNWGRAQILILAWYLDKEKRKAHLTIYTREYLLILIIFFLLVVFLFSLFLYFMIGDHFVCFSGAVVVECICNQFYF